MPTRSLVDRRPNWVCLLCSLAVVLFPVGVLANPTSTSSVALDPELEALVLSAQAAEALSDASNLEGAVRMLEKASSLDPRSSAIFRDLAIAYARQGHRDKALATLRRATELGDRSADGRQLLAILGGKPSAGGEDDWQAELLKVINGDPEAALRAQRYMSERTPRGAMSALVLGSVAGQNGDAASALALLDISEQTSTRLGSATLVNAVRGLRDRLGPTKQRFLHYASVHTALEHATNPAIAADGSGVSNAGLRWNVGGQLSLYVPVGSSRLDTAFRVDQQLYLTERDALSPLELTAFALAAGFETPLTASPTSARLGFRLRARDVWGRLMRVHYSTAVEGGPTLTVPFGTRTALELGVFGNVVDFIDRSPADVQISSQNRDRTGQRARVAYVWRTDWLAGELEALFMRDDAKGDAFDHRGGAIGGRLRAALGDGIFLTTGLGVAVRSFGPVGEERVIGSASTRTETRLAVELGARVPLTEKIDLVLDEFYVRSSAARGHAYTNNVVSLGVEAKF